MSGTDADGPVWQAASDAYRLLFDQSSEMVCLLDREGRFTSINRAGEELTGYAADDLVGTFAVDLVPPELRDEAASQFRARLRGEAASLADESVLVTAGGMLVPIEVKSSLVRYQGRPVGVLGLVSDLTERRRAEAALKRGEERFRVLLELAPDGLVFVDGEGQIVLVNAQTEKLFGFSREELAGRPVSVLLPGQTGPLVAHRMGADLESIGRRKDGSRFPVEISLSPLETPAGRFVTAAIRDVTARVEAEHQLAERERSYRLLAENSTDLVTRFSLDGELTYLSPACEALLGYRPEELLGRSIEDLLHPDQLAGWTEHAALIDSATQPVVIEGQLRHRDGRWLWFEASVRAVRDTASGLVSERQAAVRLIEERKRAEADLRDAEALFRGFFEQAPIGEAIVALDGRFLQVNDALCRLVGFPESELIARTFQDLTHPDDLDDDLELVRQTLAGAIRGFQMEKRYIHRLGHPVWVLLSVSLVHSPTGEPAYFISQIQDIGERRSAQEAVVQSEARLAEAQHVARVGSWESDFSTGTIAVSHELCRLFEIEPATAEVSLEQLLERIHPDDRESIIAADRAARRTNSVSSLEYRIELADGGVRWIHARGEPLWVEERVVGRRGTSQDITERKEAEQRLAAAVRRYKTLVEQLPLGTYVRPLDMSRPNLYASPQVEPMLGYPAADWQSDPGLLARIVHPDDRDRVLTAAARVRRTGAPLRDEYRYIARDGRTVWVQDETYRVVGENGEEVVQGFLLDITERKQAEEERDRLHEQLHQAQKLEAVGRLAGGVAHDFNNMLTAIKGYSELLLAELDPGTVAHHEAEQIRRAAEQASTLPTQLLAFSRNQTLEPRLVDLNTLVAGISELLRHLISETIELEVVPTSRPAFVRVDPAGVEPVLVNLALNARDAMPSGGTLTITTTRVELGSEAAAEHQVPRGPFIVLSVADNGDGMDADTAARAFEPFYTTKPQGKGSGLGLAGVYGTVRQSGGFVLIESQPGTGTTVQIHLPAAAGPPAAGDAPQPEALPHRAHEALRPRAKSVVLLAEDEEIVRALVTRILERAGYDVHAAASGNAALSVLERLDRPIDILVTDMVMPGLSGRQLAERVLEQQPKASVVFMSGYSEEPPAPEEGNGTPLLFLRKPFSSSALLAAVGQAGDRTAAGGVPEVDGLSCLVADDHPAILDSVSEYLAAAGLRIVARAARADQALQAIETQQPATALIDIALEPFDGIELARQAAATNPNTRFVLYTGSRDPEHLRQALATGVRGFVVKDAPLSELVEALITVANGGTHIDAELATALATAPPDNRPPPLTGRQRQILSLIAAGQTNEKIAAELGISPETVQSHVRTVMDKLGVETRTQAVATALRQSLIP